MKKFLWTIFIVCAYGYSAVNSPLRTYFYQKIYTTEDYQKSYFPSGALDTTFAAGIGYEILDFAPTTTLQNLVYSVALDSAENIVYGGSVPSPTSAVKTKFLLSKLSPKGVLDTSFGTDGYVIQFQNDEASLISSIVIDSSDRILVGGTVGDQFYVYSFLSNGTDDPDFGGGKEPDLADSFCNKIILDPQGRILAGGSYLTGGKYRILIARYSSDGILDVDNFNPNNGYVTTTIVSANNEIIYSLAVDSSGGIIAVGGTGNDLFVLKFLSDGSGLDTNFATDGVYRISAFGPSGATTSTTAYSVTIDRYGNIVVGGASKGWMALLRLTPSGALDTTLGGVGYLTFQLADLDALSNGACYTVKTDALGCIIMCGVQEDPNTSSGTFTVVRVNREGSLDTSFGSGSGYTYSNLGTADLYLSSGLIDDQGNILVAGYTNANDVSNKAALARFGINYTLAYYQSQFNNQPVGLFG